MAAMTGATVTGIDLTPEFVEAARLLSDRVGLGDRTEFRTTAASPCPSTTGRSTRPSWSMSA
jgi:2-polyprenyl-3-methyl-5-hydroxy-6-metoxy-1,4-benzoquinol methylase